MNDDIIKRITVFTPTYNRAYILHYLYESLRRQTFTNFEWLVIDDGSSDNTQELLARWIEEKNAFSIRYVRQENGGKCRAINCALELARGELFFTVDSDDYLTDDALEKVDRWAQSLPEDGKYCGFAGNLGTSQNETPNKIFEEEYLEGAAMDRYRGIDGERAMVFFTEIHRRYTYPVFEGEKFMTEAVVWNRMAADGYKMRFYNDIIWIYEYKEDGLTKAGSRLFLNNPRGYGLWLKEKAEFDHDNLMKKLRMIYTFTCDLAPLHDVRTIAQSIGAPTVLIMLMKAAHSFRQKVRKRG